MKSITKFNITDKQVISLFEAAAIRDIIKITEISDGWYNSVFSVSNKNGNKYVIKIAPEKTVKVLTHEQNIMASEIRFYKLIKEKTSIKTPEIVFVDFSEKLIPTAYFIMEFLNGERLDKSNLSSIEQDKVNDRWSWILAEMHNIKGDGFGYEQAGLKDNWKDGLTHMTQILINDAVSFGKKCKVGKKLLKYIDMFSDALINVPSVFVNFDLHAMNMFFERKENGEVELAMLDLERAFWGDPIGDFVIPDLFKPLEKKSLLSYYNKYASTPINVNKDEQVRFYLMRAYLAVIMYTERFSRFKSVKKFFNPIYLGGTFAYIILAKTSFRSLKRLAKNYN